MGTDSTCRWRQAGMYRLLRYWPLWCLYPGKNYKHAISKAICSAEGIPLRPFLQTSVVGNLVKLTWNSSNQEAKYRITYSSHGKKDYHDIEMAQQTEFSINLPRGSDYDAWVLAYNGNCDSEYSQSVRVRVP
jgi:hypothetical protein